MSYDESEQYWIWLSSIGGIGVRRFYKLLSVAEDIKNVYEQPGEFKNILGDKLFDVVLRSVKSDGLMKALLELEDHGVRAITRISDLYPDNLSRISDPPPTLFVKGSADLRPEKPFAMVGTRRASYDGKKAAREFAKTLTENGACIISGLARGIDTFAHTACLDAGGKTIAVLGNGLGSVYPPENKALAERIVESGGSLVSEMALNETPSKWSFPARNRIIAGLSSGVLVVEGDKRSGALITAQFALEEGRDIFAIPGSIYSYLSEGTNELIQNGAYMALCPGDIIEAMRWGTAGVKSEISPKEPELDENEKKIYDLLKRGALSFDEIENLTQFSTSVLNSHLTMLTLRSIIIKLPGNLYRLS